MDGFVAEFIIGPAEGGTRWLLAMAMIPDLTDYALGVKLPSLKFGRNSHVR